MFLREEHKGVMRAVLLLCFLFGGVSLASAQPVQIRPETPRPLSYPDLSTRVSITDGEGTPYVGLREENVRLTLNRRPVDPSDMYAVFADSARLGVVFVVDRSGSVGEASLRQVRRAIQYVSATFSPHDQIGLVTFDSDVRVPAPVGTSREEFERRVKVIRQGSDTALHDAIQRGSEMLNAASADRRALMVFSDGRDTRSALSAEDIEATLRTTGWPVYAFGVGEEVDPTALQRFASITNGEYISGIDKSSLSSLYSRLVRPLEGLHYVLQFPFNGDPLRAMHRLQIEVRYQGQPYRAATLFSDDLVPRQGVE